MEIGAVRQITWSGALVRKIYGRRARIGLLGFGRDGHPLSADFAAAGFEVVEAPYARGLDVLFAAATCAPGKIAANLRAGMLAVAESVECMIALEFIMENAGLRPGRDVFLCHSRLGNPLPIRGATPECAKLGCALYLQVAESVAPSVRRGVDHIVDSDSHTQR